MWSLRHLSRIDFRTLPILFMLFVSSLLILSSQTGGEELLTPIVQSQLQWYGIGACVYLFFAGFDYHKLREWTWILYLVMIFLLIGVFFTDSIQNVHRWYRVPFLKISFQPSEFAKLVVVIALSWFIERRRGRTHLLSTLGIACLIVGIPFALILKQPDLGTALVFLPITLVMFYIGDMHAGMVKIMMWGALGAFLFVAVIFLGLIPHETMRPFATKVLKEYQFARLDPDTHHQGAAATAVALGGLFGTGWKQSEYVSGGWLPAPYTDSVFPAFGEEFGLFGLLSLLTLFYLLISFSFRVTTVAKDHFGRLLAAGVTSYLAIHILINVGMMCGFLPITGVPLILVTYGGSSILFTMAALGILQSIYSRRFMF